MAPAKERYRSTVPGLTSIRRESAPLSLTRGYFALYRAGVQLARTTDLVVGIGQHLVPLSDPAHRTRQREDGSEQRGRNADGALNDAGIEVHVRVELALDEVRIFQRNALEFHGQLEQRIVFQAQCGEHFLAGFLHELGTRIVVLVDTMAKAHQAYAGALVLHLLHELADVFQTTV